MYFDNSFFEEEVREGFLVNSMMKKSWAAQLEILEEIDRICKKYQIMYFAEWGTLLGAVRHHGFIPWDDDMDIGMKRKDYWRFLDIAKDELNFPFELINSRTDKKYKEVMTRVTNGHAVTIDKEFLDRFHGCPYLCGIDIFPNDNIPDDETEAKLYGFLFDLADYLGLKWGTGEVSDDEMKYGLSELEEYLGRKIIPPDNLDMSQYLIYLSEQIASTYYMENTKYIGQIDIFATYGYKLPAELLESTIEMPFENTSIPVAVGYDRILKKKYGDNYMIPVRGGGSHDYPLFRKQQDLLFDALLKKYGEIPIDLRY